MKGRSCFFAIAAAAVVVGCANDGDNDGDQPPSATFQCDKVQCEFPAQGCYDSGFDCFFEDGARQAACEALNHGSCFAVPADQVKQRADGSW